MWFVSGVCVLFKCFISLTLTFCACCYLRNMSCLVTAAEQKYIYSNGKKCQEFLWGANIKKSICHFKSAFQNVCHLLTGSDLHSHVCAAMHSPYQYSQRPTLSVSVEPWETNLCHATWTVLLLVSQCRKVATRCWLQNTQLYLPIGLICFMWGRWVWANKDRLYKCDHVCLYPHCTLVGCLKKYHKHFSLIAHGCAFLNLKG